MEGDNKKYSEEYLRAAHKASFGNKGNVLESVICGCFYCMENFLPKEIEEWVEENPPHGKSAMCPNCGIDSVIGSSSGFPVTEKEFLSAMNKFYF